MRRNRIATLFPHLIVQVKGPHLEQFINECTANGYHLWDTKRASTGTLIVRMHARTFKHLRALEHRRQWDIRIVEKIGAGFLINRLLRRRPLLIGSVAAWIVWYVLSAHVWFVVIEGTERVETESVLAVAKASGLMPGTRKENVDVDRVQRALLLGLDDLVWAGIELRGTRATVRVAERRLPDEITQGPGHIVAMRDGVIERISVIQGHAVVQPGDTVRRGQILISGLIEPGSPGFSEKLATGELPYERAGGSVRAIVWHEGVAEIKVGSEDRERIKRQVVDIATDLARSFLEAEQAQSIGDPVVSLEDDLETGSIRANVLIQAVQDIGTFEAVVP